VITDLQFIPLYMYIGALATWGGRGVVWPVGGLLSSELVTTTVCEAPSSEQRRFSPVHSFGHKNNDGVGGVVIKRE